MARYAYVNGRYVDHREAMVHVEDRGYQLADGVYEVVGVRDGKLIDETLHIDRLGRVSVRRAAAFALAGGAPTLGFIMSELMRRNRAARRAGLHAGSLVASRGAITPSDHGGEAGTRAQDQERQAGGRRSGARHPR